MAAAAFAILETAGITLLATAAVFDVMGSNNTAEAIKYVGNNLIDGAETLVSSNGPILTPFPITQGEGINKTTIAPQDHTVVTNDNYVGKNVEDTGKRANSDLPGGKATAKSIFKNKTKGQQVEQSKMKDGGVRRSTKDGTNIRFHPNGNIRLDLPKGDNPKPETIHFND